MWISCLSLVVSFLPCFILATPSNSWHGVFMSGVCSPEKTSRNLGDNCVPQLKRGVPLPTVLALSSLGGGGLLIAGAFLCNLLLGVGRG